MYQLTKVRLVAAATYLPEDYLRLRLRCQLIATATYLAKPRFTKPRYQLVASIDPSSLRYGSPNLGTATKRLECSDVGAQEAIGPNAHQGAPIGKVGSLQSTKVFVTRLSVLGGKNNTR